MNKNLSYDSLGPEGMMNKVKAVEYITFYAFPDLEIFILRINKYF